MLTAVNVTLPTGRAKRAGLALLAGLLMCAGLPPWGWWPATIVGVALWVLLLVDRPWRARFWIGVGVGLTLYLPSTVWMVRMAPGAWPFAVAVWFPLIFGVASAFCPPRFAALALPGTVVLTEWFRWHAPFGGVPLSMFAYTQGTGPLLPIARVFGTLGVSGAVAVAGVSLGSMVQERSRRSGLVGGAVLVLIALLSVVAPQGTADRTITAAAIQGGGEQETEHFNTDYEAVLQKHLDAARTIDDDVDLVVLPENIVNIDGFWDNSTERDKLIELAVELDTTLVVGVVEDRNDDEHFWNFATAISPEGDEQGRYDKVRRVPFGEYVPLRSLLAPLAGDLLPRRDAMPGSEPAVLDTTLGRLGVVISWETFFPRRVRDAVHHDGTIILNPTNGSSYWLTQVQTQQVAASTLRAVESGRWMVQSAPTGLSAIIAPSGEIIERSGIGEAAVVSSEVELRSGTTLAMWWNEVPVLLLSTFAILGAWWLDRRRRIS